MPSLSERLKEAASQCVFEVQSERWPGAAGALFAEAAAVCAAVEAFQAAEQEYEAARKNNREGWQIRQLDAEEALAAAKARLLEVNLG